MTFYLHGVEKDTNNDYSTERRRPPTFYYVKGPVNRFIGQRRRGFLQLLRYFNLRMRINRIVI